MTIFRLGKGADWVLRSTCSMTLGHGGRCRGWGVIEALEDGLRRKGTVSSSRRWHCPLRLSLERKRHCQELRTQPGASVKQSSLRTMWCPRSGKVWLQEGSGKNGHSNLTKKRISINSNLSLLSVKAWNMIGFTLKMCSMKFTIYQI